MNNNIEKIRQIKQLEQSIKTMEENLRVAETRYQGYSSIPKQQVMEQILNLTNSIRKKKEELTKLLQSSSFNNSSSLEDRLASIRETSYQNKLVTDRLTAGLDELRSSIQQPVAQTSFMDRLTQRLTGNSNNKKEITVDDLEDLLADVELPKGGKRRRKRKSNKKRNTYRVNKRRHTRRLNNRRRK